MIPKKITETVSVGPQIWPSDPEQIGVAGCLSIICHRPDDEAVDQPGLEGIQKATKKLGIQSRYVSAQSGVAHDEDTHAFGATLDELPGPTRACCRTSARSATLWLSPL